MADYSSLMVVVFWIIITQLAVYGNIQPVYTLARCSSRERKPRSGR